MKIRGQSEYLVRLETVAIADIILNLFVFFFISFSLLYTFNPARWRVKVSLPETSIRIPDEREPMVISIDEQGKAYLLNDPIAPELIATKLKNMGVVPRGRTSKIIVRGDRTIEYDAVGQVLEALRKAGFSRINLATIVKKGRR